MKYRQTDCLFQILVYGTVEYVAITLYVYSGTAPKIFDSMSCEL